MGYSYRKEKLFKECLNEIVKSIEYTNCKWITIGKKSKNAHPHLPLYLKTNSELENFDIYKYIKTI